MAHPTRLVQLGDQRADVDEEVADVVLELWRAGIETASACQDEGESIVDVGDAGSTWVARTAEAYRARAYVDFVWVRDVTDFFDAVANGGPRDDLYARMANPAVADAWETRITVYDALPSRGTGDWSEPSAFALGVARVRFPRTDAPTVAARLARHNAGERGPHSPPA